MSQALWDFFIGWGVGNFKFSGFEIFGGSVVLSSGVSGVFLLGVSVFGGSGVLPLGGDLLKTTDKFFAFVLPFFLVFGFSLLIELQGGSSMNSH